MRNKEKMNLAMAGFSLKNTLSENGAVTRGVWWQMQMDI